jgi:drug/metabolite transporter (DMT)-like permease
MHPLVRAGLLTYIIITASICYILILKGIQSAPPFAFSGLRTVLGGLTLILLAGFSRWPLIPERRLWKWIPAVGLTATALTFGSMFLSPLFAGAGLASILGNAQPLFIAVIGFFLLKERLAPMQILALLLGLGGIMVIISPSLGADQNNLLAGTMIALLTSLSAAVGSVLVRFIRIGNSLISFSGLQLILGGIFLLGLSAVTREPMIDWSWPFLVILLVLGVFNSAIVTWAWFYLLQHEKAGSLSIYLFLTPALGVLWATVFTQERLQISSLIGGVLVIGAILLKEIEGFRKNSRLKG